MVVLLFNRNKERGEELKVPYHARATSARDGNMPSVTAACLIPDTSNSSFYGCHLYIDKQTGCDNTRQCTTIPNNMRQYQIIYNNTKQYATIPNNIRQYQTICNNMR